LKDGVHISFYAERVLSEQLAREARQRGVNRSELLRYILRLFFDLGVVNCPHFKVNYIKISDEEAEGQC